MRSLLKYLLRTVVTLVLTCALSLIVFLFAANTETVKDRVEEEASRALGGQFDIAGYVFPGVTRNGVSLSLNQVSLMLPEDAGTWAARQVKFSLPLIGTTTYRLTGEATQLRFNETDIGSVVLPLEITDEAIQIEPISGTLYGGDVSGKLKYKAGFIEAHIELSGYDHSRFIDGAAGPGLAKIYLYTDGTDAQSMIAGLNGTLILRGGRGHLPGNAINMWGGDPVMALGGSAAPSQKTDVNCFLAEIKVRKGKAMSEKMMLDTPRVTLFGAGHWDMVVDHLDLTVKPQPKNAKALNLATPIRLVGPIANPQTIVNRAGVAAKVGELMAKGIDPAALAMQVMNVGKSADRCGAVLAAMEHAAGGGQ